MGPAPDPGRLATVGPPTPRGLRAAPIARPLPPEPRQAETVGAGRLPAARPPERTRIPTTMGTAAPELPAASPPPSPRPASTPQPPSGQRPPAFTPPNVTRGVGPAFGSGTGAGQLAQEPPPVEGTTVGLAPSLPLPLPLPVAALPPEPAMAAPAPRVTLGGTQGPLTRRCTSCNELYPADFLVCPRDATPLVAVAGADADPLVGALVGETYQIVRVVGEGGMGRVYEARHLRLKERRFAVKCLHSDLARNAEMAARFLREAETASSIKHDNVVDVFDVHHLADGTPYLVGEFLEGEELADYVTKRGPLDPQVAAKVARQVCDALEAAHERGIVHRDMKPENVFVLAASIAAFERGEARTLRVKVLDFGISKAGPGDNSQLTRTGVIMGTPSYMAPEQARGRPVDHRADVYSLGACLYFMVTGKRPFDSDDPTSTLSMVLTEDPVRPREIDQRIPEMLELIIQRAMAKDANDRYASMRELEKALAMFAGASTLGVPSGGSMVPVGLPTPDLAAGGAARAFDVAKALLGNGSLPPPSSQSGDLARTARPTIVVTSLTLGAWLVGGTVAALAGLVRVLHDGEITLTESLLLVVGCLFAAATPIGLYVMHIKKVVWPNSVRALQLASDLKRTTVSALVAYGGLAVVGRIVHTVLWRSSRGLASGFWDIALFFFSVVAALTIGGFAPLLRNLRRRRRRD
ncbi:MAG: protein kinase [Labilithrix sp.]|nr:protein kinase [Labilithrix sp.]